MAVLRRDHLCRLAALAACGVAYAIYLAVYLPYLPMAGGRLGHDYSLHFPNLLAGEFWFLHNGLFAIPWFSPAQCGGMAYVADPNVAYVSLPQILTFAVTPMRAVQTTFTVFALIALAGAYLLMRRGFAASRTVSTAVAILFLFNGFFVYRVIIGHLTFHAFALTPLVAALLLLETRSWRTLVLCAGAVASGIAYMFESGMVHGIPPALLSIAMILCLHALMFGWQWRPWLMLGAAGAAAIAICAGHLAAELALIRNFPRDDYPLPGFASPWSAILTALRVLFYAPPPDMSMIVNAKWALDRHEWEFGISFAPLVMIAAACLGAIQARRSIAISPAKLAALMTLVLLAAIPIGLNLYQPNWNAVLKATPYFANSSSLLRFFSAYILPIVIVSGLALDSVAAHGDQGPTTRLTIAAIALGALLGQTFFADRSYYDTQDYRIAPIEAAYARAAESGIITAITTIGDGNDPGTGPNDAMISGRSQLSCYQPLFGYRLERFPRMSLHAGAAVAADGKTLNVKNPACYLFPRENNCRPGDHFTIDQRDDAAAFLDYRPFRFAIPWWQIAALWISGVSLGAMMLCLLCVGVFELRHRRQRHRAWIESRQQRS